MKNNINNQINDLEKKELKILNKKEIIKDKFSPIFDKISSKVPDKLKSTLDSAFYKGFLLVFENGTKYIEKMYDKEKIQIEHSENNCYIENSASRKNLKIMDKHAKKSKLINTSISTIEGAGLGLLGMGLPDVPLFIAMILKTIYEIALSYGFKYESDDEKKYILSLICAALTNGETQGKYSIKVDEIAYKIEHNIKINYDLEEQIKETSNILSDSLLVPKFVQGIPIVGVVGSITNYNVINKISKFSTIKYKKRYLNNKL